jgi:lysophospholipase L1-like esterase
MKRLVSTSLVLLVACTGQTPAAGTHPSGSGGAAATGGKGSGGQTAAGGSVAGGATGGSGVGGSATGGSGTGGSASGGSGTGGSGRGGSGAGGGGGSGAGGGGGSGIGGSGRGGSGAGGSATGGASGGPGTGGAPPDAGTARDLAAELGARDLRVANDVAAERPTSPLSVYIAGDSTVSTYVGSSIKQAGWGQFLQDYFQSSAKIVNKAVGGMTARHYIEAGYLDEILAAIKAGDYLLVQFGTNDGNKTATYTLPGSSTEIPYYLDPQTDFKTYLKKYVDATRAKSATTIFVTPPPRHTCDSGETGVRNGLAAYAAAMNELGPTLDTPVVDLNAMTMAYLANITCETSGKTFYLVKADGSIDGTHFQENGANIMAGLVAKGTTGISTLGLPLSAYVK